MKISVIVPCYNVAEFIPRCLNSILSQTYNNIEIIAVNDGSTDYTAQTLNEYAKKHSNIKVIHKENGGVTSARLRGVREASGEWIGFVDSDDEIEPEMYERLLRNAEKYNAQISHCGYQMIFADGRVHYFHNTGKVVALDNQAGVKALLDGSMIEPGLCNKLFHKTLLHSLFQKHSVPTDIKINEDLLMNYYLFSEAEISVFDDFCPYHYIVRDTSASRTTINRNKIYDPIKVKTIIRSHSNEDIQKYATIAYVNTCINIYNMLLTADEKYKVDMVYVRKLLSGETSMFTQLSRKRRIMAWLIVKLPLIYKPIFKIYSSYFQKSVYS